MNNKNCFELDVSDDRNFITEIGFAGDSTLKRRADDVEHQDIWKTRSGMYKEYAWKYFVYKWSGTWKKEPEKQGWVKKWPIDFIENPPDITKSKQKTIMKYLYFEKDLYNHDKINYL